MNNFWQKLNKPFYCLAPIAGVSDSAFRQMCKAYGADVVYSEMASVNALSFAPEKTLEMLRFEESERPYVVQLFGSEEGNFEKAVRIIEKEIKPDGIDINFGCPVPKVAKQNAGAELAKDLVQSRKVVEVVVKTATVPVSVKIRKKAGDVDALQFLDNIKDLDVKAVMIHGRDLKQMHVGEVDAEIIRQARNHFGGIIIANGGVKDLQSAQDLLIKSGADGLGIAQGAFGKPWIFSEIKSGELPASVFDVALQHAESAFKLRGKTGILEMRKHLCWYVQGLPGARKIREEFVRVETIEDIRNIIKKNVQ
ncbi:tRNA-dihydrouridine synthase [Candidatus Parcubacteria bacterium]|nr:tRNA-dihydrouridine synthase [Patescibacteria group bacterium]MBU4309754.1 tRNA-dihydrouridine synthase [Patescibacteria group bacterium]MBU4431760.1 tRNA-dihydrouridine synthase [Patescibacteria group bacterium]MBU4578093.1 tRNA-dihydrouridine synthase [Patescibacteria group bacterium]MCG2696631.1 tRNA-dihydrouridine synthase [Candidatus Parcubacteria bacterium]